jgi:competence protein ComEA
VRCGEGLIPISLSGSGRTVALAHSAEPDLGVAAPLRRTIARGDNDAVQSQKRFVVAAAGMLAASVLTACLGEMAGAAFGFAQTGSAQSVPKTKPVPPPQERVDINHASADELLKVPGMTASWAGRIIRFRPYRSKQDLLDRGVLPSDVYDRIKDYVIAHRSEQ